MIPPKRTSLELNLQPIEENDDIGSSMASSSRKNKDSTKKEIFIDISSSMKREEEKAEVSESNDVPSVVLKTIESELSQPFIDGGLPTHMQKQWSGIDFDVCTPENKRITPFMPLNTMSA